MNFTQLSEDIWRWYSSHTPEGCARLLELLAPDCVVIGPGAHELYDSREAFAKALRDEQEEAAASGLQFRFDSFQCTELPFDEDSRMTCGTLRILFDYPQQDVHMEMQGRFTLVFQQVGGVWKVFHIHHSVANRKQLSGEYYPQTLSAQMEEIQKKVLEMQRLAERDSLTGLFNLRTLEQIYALRPIHESAWLLELDLDHFKAVNDTFGHVAGNQVLCRVSDIFREAVREGDTVARTGGDEFVIFLDEITEDALRQILDRILVRMDASDRTEDCWTSLSIGAVRILPAESLHDALVRADQALYDAKQQGKHRCCIRP